MSSRAALPLAFVLLGVVVGVGAGLLREATVPSAMLLYAEPLPAVLGVWVVHLCFARGRWEAGVGAAIGTSCLLILARLSPPLDIPWAARGDAGATPVAAPCAVHASVPDSFILGLWSGADDLGTISTLADVADVLVLTDPDVDVERALAEAGGEVLSTPGATWVWARGGFSLCGETGMWPVGRRSALVFAAPGLDVSVPLLVTNLPALGEELEAEVADVGAAAEAIGGHKLVVAGAGSFPTSFQRTDRRLAEAGLGALRLPPNAPSAWRGLPLVSVRSVNRVWSAAGWSDRAEVWRGGRALRAPVLLRLDYQTP